MLSATKLILFFFNKIKRNLIIACRYYLPFKKKDTNFIEYVKIISINLFINKIEYVITNLKKIFKIFIIEKPKLLL